MKKAFLSLVLFSTIATAAGADNFPDGEWRYGSASLKVQRHPPINGYYYSLSYTLPNNTSVETDECNASSSTQLQCVTNDNVALNINNHSVLLNNNFTFYEKGYEPNQSPLVGSWQPVPETIGCHYTKILVPYTQADATVFNDIRLEEDGGYSNGVKFYLKIDTRGNLYFGSYPDAPMMGGYYLYDKENQQINDMRNINAVAKLKPSNLYGPWENCAMAKIP